jgi:nitroimidazol reductase NimA-like FMN-containing flavoprotein (pyridoxamine 5'-phosphate oxidase superfamily)
MEDHRIVELLGGPHQAVLSVSRDAKGPVAVPMSYHFSAGTFFMATSPDSLHGRLMTQRGRATVTVQYAFCDGSRVHQWYVMAEGPIRFSSEDPMPHIMEILVKDRGSRRVEEWRAAAPSAEIQLAVLEPERIAGYESIETLAP